MPESLKTPFYENHVAAKGKLVDFAGWSLPIHYGSLVEEHEAVRNAAGMFDVSHMTLMDVKGEESIQNLRLLCTNDIEKLDNNTALYGCLCRENGGVVDDLIIYRINEKHYRVISNAGTRSKVLDWFASHNVKDLEAVPAGELAMLAVQGPEAVKRVQGVSGELFGQVIDVSTLPNFGCVLTDAAFVGRTGYTGEDGLEIVVPKDNASNVWNTLIDAGVRPCGLGARDTLRLEAAMSLYGNDLDDEHSPMECGVGWTVDLNDEARAFVGRGVLEDQKVNGSKFMRIGIELGDRGVLRAGQKVTIGDKSVGVITSGTYSPTLQRTIALARIERDMAPAVDDRECGLSVEIRNKPVSAFRVRLPFLRKT